MKHLLEPRYQSNQKGFKSELKRGEERRRESGRVCEFGSPTTSLCAVSLLSLPPGCFAQYITRNEGLCAGVDLDVE